MISTALMIQITLLVIGLIAFRFWLSQLLLVIKMRDSEFLDRNDKLMWFLLVFFGSILGALLFWFRGYEFSNAKAKETELKLEREFREITKEKA